MDALGSEPDLPWGAPRLQALINYCGINILFWRHLHFNSFWHQFQELRPFCPLLSPKSGKPGNSIFRVQNTQNRLHWGRSNLVDPAEWRKIGLLNRDFGSNLSAFLEKNSRTQSSLNFLQSGPRKFTKSDFSGLAPIQRVLKIPFFNPLLGHI